MTGAPWRNTVRCSLPSAYQTVNHAVRGQAAGLDGSHVRDRRGAGAGEEITLAGWGGAPPVVHSGGAPPADRATVGSTADDNRLTTPTVVRRTQSGCRRPRNVCYRIGNRPRSVDRFTRWKHRPGAKRVRRGAVTVNRCDIVDLVIIGSGSETHCRTSVLPAWRSPSSGGVFRRHLPHVGCIRRRCYVYTADLARELDGIGRSAGRVRRRSAGPTSGTAFSAGSTRSPRAAAATALRVAEHHLYPGTPSSPVEADLDNLSGRPGG